MHGLEEYRTGFLYRDPLMILFANRLALRPEILFIVVQILLGLLLILPAFLSFRRPWLRVIFGAILLFEVDHIIHAISSQTYYPGLWTAIPLVIIGIFYWKLALSGRTT